MSAPLSAGAELVPGYRVVGHLARNEALDVYDLYSVERECRCVAKLVRHDRDDARAPARLVQEGEVLLSLTHPHLVRAYELVREPRLVLILETLTGHTLGGLLEEEGPLDADDVAELGLQLCSAIGYLHRKGWLHLDLKPDNIIAQAGVAKVLDLSLSRRPGPARGGLGTREYAAPEQAAGGELGASADVWGLGAVLYKTATGRSPVAALDAPGKKYPQISRPVPPLAGARLGLPAGLAAAIDACLDRDPAARPTVAELAASLAPHAPSVALAA